MPRKPSRKPQKYSEMDTLPPVPLQAGTLLIAAPVPRELEDPRFAHTVVLLVHQQPGEAGSSMGVVLNRPLGEEIERYSGEALRQLATGLEAQEPGALFFQGGPVECGEREESVALIYLHRLGELAGSKRICDQVYAFGELEIIRAHAKRAGEEEPLLRFYLGYAGWGPYQLEAEIAAGLWYLCPASADLVFDADPGAIWQQALYSLGGKYRALSFFPSDPSVN